LRLKGQSSRSRAMRGRKKCPINHKQRIDRPSQRLYPFF
jgi:hypothetical protein